MTWTAEQDAIFAYWRANAPVPQARRDESDWNAPTTDGKPFNPPALDTAAPANSIWIRFVQRAVPRSGRPFAIGGSAPTYRQGLVIFQVFYPRGYGEEFAAAAIASCWSMFHRRLLLASPQIQFRDSQPPERIPPEPSSAEWMQVNVTTPYEVIE